MVSVCQIGGAADAAEQTLAARLPSDFVSSAKMKPAFDSAERSSAAALSGAVYDRCSGTK
jgi:hypothetical protein